MNEADPSPINLDELRLVPDWLREDASPPSKQYAAHDYPLGEDRPGRREGGRPGGFAGRGGPGDRRGPGGPDRRREGGGRSGPPPRGGEGRPMRDDRRSAPPPPTAPALPAPVRVEFLPDDRCLVSINKQIRSTHLAYPLFGLARMFLQEPARHFVQLSVLPDAPEGTALHQLGEDGIVTLDRATLERLAFDSSKDQFYTEETVQKEPLKGNFTNVARERLSGTLLGPTNHHAYQPALRSLYEARYSRRMSFEEFRRNIEVSTDPALIEKWKEEARTTTTINTKVGEGETPTVLSSPADARAHFRQHHLDALVHGGKSFRLHGSVARQLPEPAMMQAIREAHDREMRYPAQFVQLLRQGLQNAGLHIFKHRKRVVYVSLARPVPFVAQGTVSPGVAAILEAIAQNPLGTRKALAEQVLAKSNPPPAAPSDVDAANPVPVPTRVLAEPTDLTAPETATPEARPVSQAADATAPASDEFAVVPGENVPANEPVAPPSAPAAASNAGPEDPVAKARAALAADLRFLVQAGHIIEFHNGTFDLPLPPKAKEEGEGQAPMQGRGAKGKPGSVPTVHAPEPTAAAEGAETAPEQDFVASGPGVEEGASEPAPGGGEPTPSLQESFEPAPTAANLGEATSESVRAREVNGPVKFEPGSAPDPEGNVVIRDKADGDGLISGPAAAPLDLPIPGDTEDPTHPPAA